MQELTRGRKIALGICIVVLILIFAVGILIGTGADAYFNLPTFRNFGQLIPYGKVCLYVNV